MNRRLFLRGLGGACVAAPFLGSIAAPEVRAQSPAPPRRLIVMFTHYGCITTRFFPKKSHGALDAGDLEPTTLKHLAPYVDKLLLPRGIRAMNEWTSAMLRGQGNNPYKQVVQSYFTCQPVTPNSNDPFREENPRFTEKPIGPSLDHVMAQQLSPEGVPLLENVGFNRDDWMSAISYSAAETMFPGLSSASQVLSRITNVFDDQQPMSPDTYAAVRGKSILDVIDDDLSTLERYDMSQSDRLKLEIWKELVHVTGDAVVKQCKARSDELLQPIEAFPSLGNDPLTTLVTGTRDGADIYSDLAVLAAICNVNPVIVLKYPPNYLFGGLGLTLPAAFLATRVGSASMQGECVEDVIDQVLKIDDYYARKFAYLVGQLNGIDEGEGTLLDNSAAVWFQEVSDGCARNLNNLPIVQVGSLGGYFKTGWAVNVEDASPDLTVGNSEFYCAGGAVEEANAITQSSGTDPSLANAPINKYYCNLMNALGVKAGADGFPLVGGEAEVTRFGKYDKTEDFVGGDVNPPMIHDPGEFGALRANS